ncbi:MAG TPA: YhjD/YihY/BrkB family envelope integrity protein, partial [Thermoanaerobaculia bacterium]|nr:YhjD/YihY/BrkB family envelope integrity protein [Thermoanaerobaculia bacterium]
NPYLRTFLRQDFLIALGPIVVLCIAFTTLFWFVPSTQVRFRSALVGGVVAAVLFWLVRYGFGIYADWLFRGRLNLIYGTVGLIVIFLLALEAMWIVILLGVEISYIHQRLYSLLRASGQQATDEPRFDVYFALRALIDVSRRFVQREEAPSADLLALRFGATDSQMLRIASRLRDGKLLNETGENPPGLIPGCDPDQITVEEVVRQMESSHRAIPEIADESDDRAVVASLFDLIGSTTRDALAQKTIGDLVRELETAPSQPARIEERFRRET